jgi:hypothetical protein
VAARTTTAAISRILACSSPREGKAKLLRDANRRILKVASGVIAFGRRTPDVLRYKEFSMALNFPNPSRSYDAARHCVCFWGYDNAREVAFQVSDDVLIRLDSKVSCSEAIVLLDTFDRHRDKILLLAKDVYTAGPCNSYKIS